MYTYPANGYNARAVLYNAAFSSYTYIESVASLFENVYSGADIKQNTSVRINFQSLPDLTNISRVYKNSHVEGADLVTDWEPFDGLRKIRNFEALYYGNNFNRLFKLDFGCQDGITNISYMFANNDQITEIPHDYFDATKVIATYDSTKDDDAQDYIIGFNMISMFEGSHILSLRDSTGNMLMSKFDPIIADDLIDEEINMRRLFLNSSIPTKDRIEFINSLSLINGSKQFRSLDLESVELVKPAGEPVDITPYLVNGKILNITSNISYVDLEALFVNHAVINIPAGSIVLPDSLTKIDVMNMFKKCVAHPDVTDISQVFIYNGTATIDYESTGLQLYKKKTAKLIVNFKGALPLATVENNIFISLTATTSSGAPLSGNFVNSYGDSYTFINGCLDIAIPTVSEFSLDNEKYYEVILPTGTMVSLASDSYNFRTISATLVEFIGETLVENVDSRIEFALIQNALERDVIVELTYKTKSIYIPAYNSMPLPVEAFYYIKPKYSVNGSQSIDMDSTDSKLISFPSGDDVQSGKFIYNGEFINLLDKKQFKMKGLKYYDKYEITVPYPNEGNKIVYPEYTSKYRLIHKDKSRNLAGIITSSNDIEALLCDEYPIASINVELSSYSSYTDSTTSKLILTFDDTSITDNFFKTEDSIAKYPNNFNIVKVTNGKISIPIKTISTSEMNRNIIGIPCPSSINIKIDQIDDVPNGVSFRVRQDNTTIQAYKLNTLIIDVSYFKPGSNPSGGND